MPENNKLDDAGLSQTDYLKAALNWQYNWIGLAGATAFALASGNGLPLVLAAGLEMMYLALVPQNDRFRRLVRSWKYAAQKRENQKRLFEIYSVLPVEMRSRYEFLKQVAQKIRANYAQLSVASKVFANHMEDKLSGLLGSYVRLLHSAYTHREYLKSVNADQIRNEIAFLERALPKDPAKVQEINQRRIEILRKRLAKFEKIRENRTVIDAQCAAIEDVLQLIRDQSVTMRDPQELSAQLDNLVEDVEHTEQSVRDMEEIFAIASPDSAEDLRLAPAPEDPRPRNRVRN